MSLPARTAIARAVAQYTCHGLAGGCFGALLNIIGGAYAVPGSGLLGDDEIEQRVDAAQTQMSELSRHWSVELSDQSAALAESITTETRALKQLAEQPADASGTEALRGDLAALQGANRMKAPCCGTMAILV